VAPIDLRGRHGTIPGPAAQTLQENIDVGGILHELAKSTGKRLLFYSAFGERSAMAVEAAKDAGLSSSLSPGVGLAAWKARGGTGNQ
jgi:sulfur dioxygenase